MNGMIEYTPDPNSMQVGTIASHSCDDNYGLMLADATIRVCQNDLTWSGPEPACIGTYCSVCVCLSTPVYTLCVHVVQSCWYACYHVKH